MYQLMFAIITPALIVGAIAERMKYSAIMLFIALWMFVVYFPLAHMVWGIDGFMNGVWNAKAADQGDRLRGRHRRAHVVGLVGARALPDPRQAHAASASAPFLPHSLVLTMVGTGMLWVGWYGFNAGSAVAADGVAANAFTTTTLAAAVAGAVWPALEWITRGKPTVLGFCSGVVAGLVVITPARRLRHADERRASSACSPASCRSSPAPSSRPIFKYDDALDTFGVHGVGGTLGAL